MRHTKHNQYIRSGFPKSYTDFIEDRTVGGYLLHLCFCPFQDPKIADARCENTTCVKGEPVIGGNGMERERERKRVCVCVCDNLS